MRVVVLLCFCITESVLRFPDLTREKIGRHTEAIKDSKNMQLVIKTVLSRRKNIRQRHKISTRFQKKTEVNELLVEV